MKKVIYSFILLAIIVGSRVSIWAQEPDSIHVNNLNTLDLWSSNNLWLHTANPASADFIRAERIGSVDLKYKLVNGNYHRITEPSKEYSTIFESEGYTRKSRITFYGKLDYNITKNKQLNWNDVLLTTPLNPYTLADSLGGNYDIEIFDIAGGIASANTLGSLKWGVLVNYKGGSSADQTDPRPLNQASRFSVKPGVVYRLRQWDFGFDFNAETYHENIDITNAETHQTPHIFLFMGFGQYKPSTSLEYTRNYNGWATSANIQANFRSTGFENIVQAGCQKIFEAARDGDTNDHYKAGDYNAILTSVSDILKISHASGISIVQFSATYYLAKGTWYDQKQINGTNGTKYWQVYNQSVRFKQNITSASLLYQYIKENNNQKKYALGVSGGIVNDNSFSYPDEYYLKFTNLIGEVFGEKTFSWKSGSQLTLGLRSGYRYNLSESSYTKGIELENKVTLPELYFKTARGAFLNGSLELGCPASIKAKAVFPFLGIESGYDRVLSAAKYYANANRLHSSIKLGLIF